MELTQEQVKFYLPKINNIFQQAYGDKYLGLDWINKRATNFYIFKVENSVVGCAVMDKNKIIAIEINSAGKGHGTKLLTKIKQHNPNAWVTVEIDSVAMIKALAKSGFTLVNNADKIKELVKDEIAFSQTIATPSLETQGLAFVRLENSSHSTVYAQLTFN